jgi:hypothetical protein
VGSDHIETAQVPSVMGIPNQTHDSLADDDQIMVSDEMVDGCT